VAEQLVLVCDVCGQPASDTVTIRAGGKSMLKDLCAKHLGELLKGTRAPKRGRPRSQDGGTRTKPSTTRSGRTGQPGAASAARSKRRKSKRTAKSASSE
jgi:hypothetical protein